MASWFPPTRTNKAREPLEWIDELQMFVQVLLIMCPGNQDVLAVKLQLTELRTRYDTTKSNAEAHYRRLDDELNRYDEIVRTDRQGIPIWSSKTDVTVQYAIITDIVNAFSKEQVSGSLLPNLVFETFYERLVNNFPFPVPNDSKINARDNVLEKVLKLLGIKTIDYSALKPTWDILAPPAVQTACTRAMVLRSEKRQAEIDRKTITIHREEVEPLFERIRNLFKILGVEAELFNATRDIQQGIVRKCADNRQPEPPFHWIIANGGPSIAAWVKSTSGVSSSVNRRSTSGKHVVNLYKSAQNTSEAIVTFLVVEWGNTPIEIRRSYFI